MTVKTALKLAAVAASLGLSQAAFAAACATTDVTFGKDYPNPPIVSANACANVAGNDTSGALDTAFPTYADPLAPWLFAAKDNIGGADNSETLSLFGGSFQFALTAAGVPGSSGTYALTITDKAPGTPPDLPLFLDFVFAVKASDDFAAYLFDNVEVDASGGGVWSVTFLNNGGQIPQLSHLSLYVREGSSSSSSSTSSGQSSSSGDIPEPGSSSLALLGLGLVASSFLMRRRSQQRG